MSLNFKAWLNICVMSVQPLENFLICILISSKHLENTLRTTWTTKPRNQFKCFLHRNWRQSHVFFRIPDQTKWTVSHLIAHLTHITMKAKQPLACKLRVAPLWAAWLFLLFCPCQCGGKYFPCTRRHIHLYLERGPSCWEVHLVCLSTSHRKSYLRPIKIRAQLGRDPAHPNIKTLTTEVRMKFTLNIRHL